MSSINFVNSIEEARKARQEEWNKAYQNKENPPPLKEEEPYDPRTLYERLQEQKQKKIDAFAEATKFGNLIHKIDNDEFDFLSSLESEEVQKKKLLAEQEEEELKTFRMNVQSKSAPLPQVPVSLTAFAADSGPFSMSSLSPLSSLSPVSTSSSGSASNSSSLAGSATARKKKPSLFAGLVKRKDNDDSSSSSGTPTTTSSTTPSATGTKRKADTSSSTMSPSASNIKDAENKKAKIDNKASPVTISPGSSSKPKPNALASLVAYDSDSEGDD
ncbi:hypothetical protein EDD11_006265 [Mortierella claussenii]|nr:hypothetical protein EDD11_006265 [Mortierella claussenii]